MRDLALRPAGNLRDQGAKPSPQGKDVNSQDILLVAMRKDIFMKRLITLVSTIGKTTKQIQKEVLDNYDKYQSAQKKTNNKNHKTINTEITFVPKLTPQMKAYLKNKKSKS